MMHSLGYALSEDYNESDWNAGMIKCGFPYIKDIPDGDHFTITNQETVRPYSPFGGTGISEGYQSSGHVAILNAMYQAVGIRVCELPATPDKVKAAMEAKANGTYKLHEPYFLGSEFHETFKRLIDNPPGAPTSWVFK